MILKPPFPISSITQHFGDNAVSLYTQGLGLKGHPGVDFGIPWGTPIPAAVDSYCYSTILKQDPAFYQAVYTIFDDTDGNSYEISYGHCSTISAQKDSIIKTGDIVAQVGNTGSVYSGGIEVSEQDKLNGSHAGSHLHFQVRLLKKVPQSQYDSKNFYINDGQKMYVSPDGFIYQVPLWNNGYAGCVNPEQFFQNDLENTIKQEVSVLNQENDESVRRGLIQIIVDQCKKLLGI